MSAPAEWEDNVLWKGQWVDIVWPTPDDYSWIISLRNRPSVKMWFLDESVIENTAGKAWLASRTRRIDDCLVIARHRGSGLHVGMLGWVCRNPDAGVFEAGRLAFDSAILRGLVKEMQQGDQEVPDLSLDACLAVRDFIFSKLNAAAIVTKLKPSNRTAARINRACGLIPWTINEPTFDLVHLGIDRSEWCRLTSPS